MSSDKPVLLDHHGALIAASAISEDVALARGYRSITSRAELQRLGFTEPQRIVPTLLIPVWSVHGEVATYQIRPDVPRIGKRGKPIKYETPKGTKMVVDVPPMARQWIGDPTRPLFITEGVRKADSAVSLGMCCIDILGVWNWRGTNSHGGKTALADWDSIALNGRDVFIAFDSDAMSKDEVRAALARLRELLVARDADVKVIRLPFGDGGSKIGLDDYLAAGHGVAELFALASSDLPSPSAAPSGAYEATESGLIYYKEVQGGLVPVHLTNFTARISAQIEVDDGLETQLQFEIDAALRGRSRKFTISVKQFAGMTWVVEQLGAEAIIYPGQTLRDHARVAIQSLSESVETRQVYSHLGWRTIDGKPVYLHARGGIGAEGAVPGIEVACPDALGRFVLPPPPEGAELVAAIRASLNLRRVGPLRLTVPVQAAVYRAPLGHCDLSVHLAGPTGEGKTVLAVLAQQHHGPGLDAEHVPGSWSSTGNALEILAFHAKDAVLLVDDFVPKGTQNDVQRMHREAERLLRAQANASARQRLRPDGTLRSPKPPRGIILSTGEDVPKGQSLRARTLVLEVSPGDLDWNAVTIAQAHGSTGLFAQAFCAYLRWLAQRWPAVQANLQSEVKTVRDAGARTGQHKRTPFMVANLAVGTRQFLEFATEVKAVTQEEATDLWRTALLALEEAASSQQCQIEHEEPTQRFFEHLRAAIASGRAHVSGSDGTPPPDPMVWGWREYHSELGRSEWKQLGRGIGWIDCDNLYLEPEAAYAAAQEQAREGGDSLSITSKTLHKRLFDKGLLLSREGSRETYTVRRQLQKARRAVLHARAASLMPRGPDQPDQPQDRSAEEERSDGASWSGLWSGQTATPDQEPDHTAHEVPARTTSGAAIGRVGQVGQVSEETESRSSRKDAPPHERFKV